MLYKFIELLQLLLSLLLTFRLRFAFSRSERTLRGYKASRRNYQRWVSW